MNDIIFSARKITKDFSGHTALLNVSMDVPGQSIFGLLGPNGAGKTTLLRIINQITAPDSGELFFRGEKLTSKHIGLIGYLPEERGLYKKMPVGEQAMYLAQLKGLSRTDAFTRLKFWFEKFEILSWWNKKVEELSKGMQQKVQFVITVVHKPELLIFDEPFSGFDPINVNLLKEEILQLKKDGCTIIFSTHNMSSVEELCDHITLLNQSQKILEGQVHSIKQQYRANIFEVIADGHLSNLSLLSGSEILESKSINGQSQYKIKIPFEANPNHLLSQLLPQLTIRSFRELLPSMNDIFISKIKENSSGQ